jgi:hypothetical protein
MSQDDQIKQMVNRFLGWRLPENFNPDGGISFNNVSTAAPTGTNLFDAEQAEQMIRHMVEEIAVAPQPSPNTPTWGMLPIESVRYHLERVVSSTLNLIDAAIPNKDQNRALKHLFRTKIDEAYISQINVAYADPNGMQQPGLPPTGYMIEPA